MSSFDSEDRNLNLDKPEVKILLSRNYFYIAIYQNIADQAAICFSSSFYQALGFGKDMRTAGFIQIDLEVLAEGDTPKLLIRPR